MGWLVLLFIALPFIEVTLLIKIGQSIGFWATLGLTVLAGVLGAALARNQGRRVFAEWQQALAQGRVPEEGLVSGLLVLVGAVLLVTPGVLSDFVGLAFLLPGPRRVIAALVRRWIAKRISDGRMRVFTTGAGQQPFERPTGPIFDVKSD